MAIALKVGMARQAEFASDETSVGLGDLCGPLFERKKALQDGEPFLIVRSLVCRFSVVVSA